MAAHEQALEHARAAGSEAFEVQALGGLADACYAQSRILSAERYFTDCVTRARAAGLARIATANAPMIGWTWLLAGDFNGSRTALDEAQALAVASGNDRAMIIVLNGRSYLSLETGDLEAAEAESLEIIRLSEQLASDRFLSYGCAMLAQVHQARGELEAARAAADRGLKAAEGSAVGFVGPWLLAVAARIVADPDQAEAYLAKGESVVETGAVAHTHIGYRRAAIDYALTHGQWDRAEHHADALAAHIGDEVTPWSDYLVTRARALDRCAAYEEKQGLTASSTLTSRA